MHCLRRLVLALMCLCACLLPKQIQAHTIIVIDGDLIISGDGSVVLVVSVTPGVMAQLTSMPIPGTVGEFYKLMPTIRARFIAGMILEIGGQRLIPEQVISLDENQGKLRQQSLPLAKRERFLVMWTVPLSATGEPHLTMTLPESKELTVAVSVVVRRVEAEPVAESPVHGSPQPTAPITPPLVIPTERSEPLWSTLWRALVVGYQHIMPAGIDHMFFIAGLYFGARHWRPLLLQVTAFTVAHSITLGLAMSGLVGGGSLYNRLVEVAIALSIAWVAIENTLVRSELGWRRTALVAIFGLVHGLGFAGALSEVAWPQQRFIPALIAANIGIEVGQLTVIAALGIVTIWCWRRPWYRSWIVVPASCIIGACGLWWTVSRLFG